MDPVTALQDQVRTQPGRPLLTWYGPADERIELSVVTFANGVAKTASFLRDELMLEPGDRVELRLGLHWQTSVWIGASAAVGVQLFLRPASIQSESGHSDPDHSGASPSGTCCIEPFSTVVSFDPDAIVDLPADNKVVVSRHPLGLPGAPLPPPLIDHARAAMSQPDVIAIDPDDSAHFQLIGEPTEGHFGLNRVREAASSAGREWGITDGTTVLSSLPADTTTGWLAAWAIPLLTHSNTIWCAPGVDEVSVAQAENATVTVR